MPEYNLTSADVLEESDTIKASVSEALSSQSSREGLKLTGLEILAFAGLKVAIHNFCGLVSRALYDKYKDFQTTKKAELAIQELVKHEGSADPIGDDEILNHCISRLIDEGVPKARAGEIAEQTLRRIKQRISQAESQ